MGDECTAITHVMGEELGNKKEQDVSRNADGTLKKGFSGNPNGRPSFVKEFREMLKLRLYRKAVDKLDDCLKSEDEKIALLAAKEVFDLLGLRGVTLVDEEGNGLKVGVIILPAPVNE